MKVKGVRWRFFRQRFFSVRWQTIFDSSEPIFDSQVNCLSGAREMKKLSLVAEKLIRLRMKNGSLLNRDRFTFILHHPQIYFTPY